MGGEEVSVSAEVFALMKRYKDAYRSARLIVSVGNAIKIIGIIAGVIVALAGFALASGTSASIGFAGVIVAIGYGLGFYLSGMLVAASGQILMANLDVAVNTSTFLSDLHRARVMSIDSDKTRRFVLTKPGAR
jgi:hypothetical protein